MSFEWAGMVLQNGRKVATYTMLAIVAGALLWYQRDDPRYATHRDIVELRHGYLERLVAIEGTGAFNPLLAQSSNFAKTNLAGLYPDVYWATDGADLIKGPNYFYDLWPSPETTISTVLEPEYDNYGEIISGRWADQLNIGDYRINEAWATANLHADVFLYNAYINTNLLTQYGKLYGKMKWAGVTTVRRKPLSGGVLSSELFPTYNPRIAYWEGSSSNYVATPFSLVADAIRECTDSELKYTPGPYDHLYAPEDIEQFLDHAVYRHEYKLQYQYVYGEPVYEGNGYVHYPKLSGGNPMIVMRATERVGYMHSSEVVPASTNVVTIYEYGCFTGGGNYVHNLHPQHTIIRTNYTLTAASGGLLVGENLLPKFDGRFTSLHIPPANSDVWDYEDWLGDMYTPRSGFSVPFKRFTVGVWEYGWYGSLIDIPRIIEWRFETFEGYDP